MRCIDVAYCWNTSNVSSTFVIFVCVFDCVLGTPVGIAKTDEPIDMPFESWITGSLGAYDWAICAQFRRRLISEYFDHFLHYFL